MGSLVKCKFAVMCRQFRVAKGLKQREVAAFLGIKPATYGNVECSPHKVIRRRKAEALCDFYQLPPDIAAEFLQAWDDTPLSEYGERNKEVWEKRNRMRSKAKHHDRLFVSLVEVLGAFLPAIPDPVCSCEDDFGSEPRRCQVCDALYNLGLNTYTSKEKTLAELARLEDKLASKAEEVPAP